MIPDTRPIILIAGPTASGKSALAAMLAERLGGVVINADAMQVYRDLPILTAQPEATPHIPHWLYETVDPAQSFSAGQWLAAARAAIQQARAAGLRPIIVGGTGMYFQSLLKGLAAIPDIPPELRQQLQQDYRQSGEAAIRARLAVLDPEAAQRIEQNDQLRLLRALEIVLTTGKTQRAWQENMVGGIGAEQVKPILLMPPREALYAACDRRFMQMIERGAIAEVEALIPRALSPDLPAMKIIGVREITAFLAGAATWDDTCRLAQQATRNYAKRQMTWFRNQWQSNKIGFTQPLVVHEDFYRGGDADALHHTVTTVSACNQAR